MISLQGSGNFFYLVVDPLTEKIFTLPPQMYSHTTWACGKSTSGNLNMNSNVRLVFTRCGDITSNKGEPTQEKIHINNFEQLRDSIERINTKNIDNWEEVSLYFRALLDTKVFPLSTNGNSLAQELKDEIGAIQISISFEKDTILFLQEVGRWVNPEDQKKIQQLIEQEKGHVLKLLEMKKKVLE